MFLILIYFLHIPPIARVMTSSSPRQGEESLYNLKCCIAAKFQPFITLYAGETKEYESLKQKGSHVYRNSANLEGKSASQEHVSEL